MKIELLSEECQIPEIIFVKLPKLRKSLAPYFSDDFLLNVVFVSDTYIKKLNADFRKIDTVTDVLSFNVDDTVGEIYISLEYIKDSVIDLDRAIDVTHEVLRMVIHGALLIAGFEHKKYFNGSDCTEEMFVLQESILKEILSK